MAARRRVPYATVVGREQGSPQIGRLHDFQLPWSLTEKNGFHFQSP